MATKTYAAKVSIGGALQSSFKSAFGGASAAIKSLGQEVKALSRQRADIKAFGESSRKIGDLRKRLEEAKVEAKKAGDALAAAEKPTNKLTRTADAAARKVASLEKSIEGQVGALGKLTLKLNQAGMKTADLERHDARLERRIKSVTTAMRKRDAAQARFGSARGKLGSWMGAGLAVGGAIASAMPAVNASNEFGDMMVDVGKFVGGNDTEADLDRFGKQIAEMGRNTEIGAKGLGALVIAGGKLGKMKDDALAFGKNAMIMAAGLDMLPEEAADLFPKMMTGMKLTEKQMLEMGDVMNYLGDVTAAEGKNIADIMRRQGAVVKSATKLTDDQIAALAATFETAAPNPETAATAMKNFTNALVKGSTATDAQKAVFKALGLEPEKIAKEMQTAPLKAMESVLLGLRNLPDDKRGAFMGKLFGQESVGTISQMVTGFENLRKNFDLVADRQAFLGRSAQEYARNQEKASVQIGIFKSQLFDLGVDVGDAIKAAFNPLLKKINPLLEKFAIWRKENPRLFRGIVMGTAVIVGLTAAIVGIGIAITAGMTAWTGLGAAFSAIGLAAAGAGTSIGGFLALVGAGIAVQVAVIGAAVLAIRKYWEPIAAFFSGVWQGIKDGWEKGGGPALWSQVEEKVGKAWEAFKKLIEPIKLTAAEFTACYTAGKPFGEWIGGALATALWAVLNPGEAFKLLWQEIKDVFNSAFDSMRTKAEPFFTWITEKLEWVGGAMNKVKGIFGGGGGQAGGAPATGKETSFSPPPMRGATAQTNTININAQPGQSPESIADAVMRRLRQQQDQQGRGSMWDDGALALS